MASPHPVQPQQGTGLPPGVAVGPLGGRLVAHVIDSVVPGILGALLAFVLPGMSGGARPVLTVILAELLVAWLLLVWRMIAVQAASPGMRLMKLQVVGFYNGRPIGWARAFLRGLLLGLLTLSGVGLLLLVVFLLLHPRRQGWHDLVARAVVIKQRGLPPVDTTAAPGQAGVGSSPDRLVAAQASPPAHLAPSGASASDPSGLPPLTAAATPEPSVPPASGRPEQDPQNPHQQPSVSGLPAPQARRQPAPVQPWLAELDDGREIAIEGLVLLGRNPQPQPGEEDAQLIKLADETRTVSKSHLAVGLDAAGLYIVDRGSTNGSTVTTPAGVSSRLRAGEIVYVDPDSVVSIGDHWLRIRRVSQ